MTMNVTLDSGIVQNGTTIVTQITNWLESPVGDNGIAMGWFVALAVVIYILYRWDYL